MKTNKYLLWALLILVAPLLLLLGWWQRPTPTPLPSAKPHVYGLAPSNDFARALAFTLRFEGFYSDNPADPGGKTMRGIIQREYDAYRREKGLKPQWVKLISDAEVRDIYRHKYWDKAAYGRLWALDFEMFDIAVNSGPANAEWMLARAKLKHPEHDHLTDQGARQKALAYDLNDERAAFFRAIVARRPASGVFLRGWLERNAQVKAILGTPATNYGVSFGLPAPDPVASPRTDGFSAADLLKAGTP